MFEELTNINERPDPFQFDTASDLWTDDHRSKQMLAFHLNKAIDVSSRNTPFIDWSVEWIAHTFDNGGRTGIADFGSGPGLYAARLAKRGAHVAGIDFSKRSIEYARETAVRTGLQIRYHHQNYLEFETEETFDLILLIMCDFCALIPLQRALILRKFLTMLKPGGAVLLDVYSLAAFNEREEAATYEVNQLNGFWSPKKYYGFLNTFKYEEEKLILDKYTIVEAERTFQMYNRLQHFSPAHLKGEFIKAGFSVKGIYGDVAGSDYKEQSREFAIIAARPDR